MALVFFFIPAVAEKLQRSEAAVRWLIHTGQLKSAKLAGRRIVTQEHLDEFFENALSDAG